MSDDPILAALSRLEASVATINTNVARLDANVARLDANVARLDAGQTRLRVDLMERMDGLQERLETMFSDISVNWHNTERVERNVETARSETRDLVAMLNEVIKSQRRLEARIAALENRP